MRRSHNERPSVLVMAALTLALSGCDTGSGGGGGGGGAGGDAGTGSGGSGGSSAGPGGGGGEGGGGVCVPGTEQLCYSGPVEVLGIGACQPGTSTCNAAGTGFGPCVGEVLPAPETCLTAGDDDCDGAVNEEGAGCACAPGVTEACYEGPAGTQGVGPCAGGAWTCNDQGTGFGPCVGQVLPAPETCGSPLDDDCDGAVNEEGSDCACSPGDTAPCYSGDPATEGVGACAGGTTTCLPSGLGWGPCAGEVIPVVEDCATPADDDCDGSAQCGGPPIWARRFGGAQADAAGNASYGPHDTVAVDAAGNVFVTGTFAGTVDFGGGPVTAPQFGAFVLKLDGAGNFVWSRHYFNGSLTAVGVGVAADGAGGVLVTGTFPSIIDFGGGPIGLPPSQSGGIAQMFLVRLDASGNHAWSRAAVEYDRGLVGKNIAVDPAGNSYVLVHGYNVVAEAAPLRLMKYDSAGNLLWVHHFTGAQLVHEPAGIEREPGGAIVVAGTRLAGSGSMTVPWMKALRLDVSGAAPVVTWMKEYENASVGGLAVNPAGGLFLAGGASASASAPPLDLGGGPIPQGGVLLSLDGSGNPAWWQSYPGEPAVGNVSRDAAGSLALVSQQWLRRVSPAGAQHWLKDLGAAGRSAAWDPAGNLITAGYFSGTIDLGAGPLTSAGDLDVFVAKFAP